MSASTPQSQPSPGPVTRAERIDSIDVLRGFALLGILVMNIQSFAMIGAAYMNPMAADDLAGDDFAIYHGSWIRQLEHRTPSSFFMQTFVFLTRFAWDSAGLMLIGMALFKLDVFSAKRSAGFYVSLICTMIFYGHGLGLFGLVSRVGLVGVAVGVRAFLLAISPIWLRYFRFGPAEWLWRSLSYLKIQPIRKWAS